KPFDLILMDIMMPVMYGLEAASRITRMGVDTPIVAITSNTASSDLELYAIYGMVDCVGKPFTSQELWQCLMKHLPVVSFSAVDNSQEIAAEEKSLNQLRVHFAKNNQNTYAEIIQAVNAGEGKLAHRLMHTLKGNAGQIRERRLQAAAVAAETVILEGRNLLDGREIRILKAELQLVLDSLAPLLTETNAKNAVKTTDPEKIREIIEKLEPMLASYNTECIDLLDDIYAIPGTEALAQQVESFEFERAVAELSAFKRRAGIA
ncbi:MAG: response regulator, partial [Treponema sp.]|nr:response regulator [Treponema sp.]